MIIINDFYDKGFKWIRKDNAVVRGYAYLKDNSFYSHEALLQYFINNSRAPEALAEQLKCVSGSFSFVYESDSFSILAVDIVRTFPIFYGIVDGELIISNSSEDIAKYFNYKIDPYSFEEFQHTGYVVGKRTIFSNVYQVEAGSIVFWDKNTINISKYFTYGTNFYSIDNFDLLSNKLLSILDDVGNKLVVGLNGATVAIPLSGGYDSRLVACLLKRSNYQNVICFSYGRKDSWEAVISKEVADKLEYKWIFIEYNDALIKEATESSEWTEYLKYGFNGVSVSHIQDFFAVKVLHDGGVIPKNTIFIPGHSGDFFAGTHTLGLYQGTMPREELEKAIWKHHYILKGKNKKKYQYFNNILEDELLSNYYPHSIVEDWDMMNRQAKFIVNSNRAYEFFGYGHRLPLWDFELVSFFKFIDRQFKNRNFMIEYIEKLNLYDYTAIRLFSKYDVNIKKHINNSNKYVKHLKLALPTDCYIIKTMKKILLEKKRKETDFDNFYLIANKIGYNLSNYININSIIISILINSYIKSLEQ